MQHIFENANYNFVKWRWHAIAPLVARSCSPASASRISRGGVPMGIDFSGGTAVVVKFDQADARRRGAQRA